MTFTINDHWKLYEAPLSAKLLKEKGGGYDCSLPCDVRMPLEKAGVIRDPVKADYSFESRWIENRSWWFIREFDSEDLDFDSDTIELVIESIDAYSDIYLNDIKIGHHESAFYPFACDIKDYMTVGKNTLTVCVTTGLENVTQRALDDIGLGKFHPDSERGDDRRACVRKPEYTVGWDWAPRAVSCGIMKNAYINCRSAVALRGVKLVTASIEEGVALIDVSVEAELLNVVSTSDADLSVVWKMDGRVVEAKELKDVLLTSGINFIDTQIRIENPALWWPSGYGSQPIYDVELSISCGSSKDTECCKYGIRTLTLDVERTDEKSRKFMFIVNGVQIFCKGGNWIPADSVYARITAEKYDILISEAKEANFNMLRIWGGGIYERDEFYDACDKYGILLWHDFMFGCITCPDHLEWFRQLVDKEMDYQTKRLRNHPSMALWCGNNENHAFLDPAANNPEWKVPLNLNKQYGLYTGNVQAVRTVRNNCPHIPYWNSSPYGGKQPESDYVGDVHHWGCMMNSDMAKRIEPFEYDLAEGRFISEYGYPGPCPRASIETYFDGKPIDRASAVWEHHNNTFEKHTVLAGIRKHYLDAENLDLDEYILYAGLVQSEMLGYSLESFRFKDYCGGGLFWMYNDTWGEVGWTIIDYYLRRKISFYGVKRAFEPIKLILRQVNGNVRLMGCNDTADGLRFKAKVGYISLDGKTDKTKEMELSLSPRKREYLVETSLPKEDYTKGLFVVIPLYDAGLPDTKISPAILRCYDTRRLAIPDGKPMLVSRQAVGNDLVIKLSSPCYIHAVYIDGEYPCSDNYFNLLPHTEKTIRVKGGAKAVLDVMQGLSKSLSV